MKKMKKTLAMVAGIVVLLGLGVSASADTKESALIVADGAVNGKIITDCNYNQIYAHGAMYSWTGGLVCQAYGRYQTTWAYSTGGNCSTADLQYVTVRTSSTTYATGNMTGPVGYLSYVSKNVRSRVDTGNGMSSCVYRILQGYSIGVNN